MAKKKAKRPENYICVEKLRNWDDWCITIRVKNDGLWRKSQSAAMRIAEKIQEATKGLAEGLPIVVEGE